jgi:hypothetical protein
MPGKAHSPLLLALALLAASPANAGEGGDKLVVIDAVGDDIDGPGFVETLEAYVSDVGVSVELTECATPPAGHDGWVELATATGRSLAARAVLWFEPHEGGEHQAYDIYLVLLEQRTGAVVVLPVELGLRRGAKMFRVLAATARMVLDTEILDDIQEVIEVSKEDPPPDPWPAPAPEEPSPAAPPPPGRTVDLSLGYVGDLGFPGTTLLSGARLGAVFRFVPWLGLGIDAGYLTRAAIRVADVEVREQRIPVRVFLAGILPLGATEGALAAFWSLEPVWVAAEVVEAGGVDVPGALARLDSGGGGEIRWRIPVGELVWLFLAVAGQGMVVSHAYRRAGETGVHSADFRLGWSAGVELVGI